MQTIPFEDIIKIQPKGVITIPKKLRKAIGITEKSLVRVRAQGKKLIVEPLYTTPYVRDFSDEEIQGWLEEDQRETEELRKEGLLK